MSHSLTIKEGHWSELGDIAGEIRRRVFIEEQQVPPDEEWDDRDPECRHFVALAADSQPLGTARLLPDGHIGRVAVLEQARGQGIGKALMQAAIQAAGRRGDTHVELSAQLQALAFYERLGFVALGDTFMEAGIPHRNMRFNLTS